MLIYVCEQTNKNTNKIVLLMLPGSCIIYTNELIHSILSMWTTNTPSVAGP